VDDAETQAAGRAVDEFGETLANGFGIAQRANLGHVRSEVGAQRDRIAVQAENKRHRQRNRRPPQAKRARDCQRGEQMRRIGLAVEQPVGNGSPAHVANEREVEPFGLGKAEFARQYGQRGIDQWQKPDAQSRWRHKSPINFSAVSSASATSAMRRPLSIAALRSAA
jgi:hypothetical protein